MEPLLAIEDVRVSFEKESGAVAVLNGVRPERATR